TRRRETRGAAVPGPAWDRSPGGTPADGSMTARSRPGVASESLLDRCHDVALAVEQHLRVIGVAVSYRQQVVRASAPAGAVRGLDDSTELVDRDVRVRVLARRIRRSQHSFLDRDDPTEVVDL